MKQILTTVLLMCVVSCKHHDTSNVTATTKTISHPPKFWPPDEYMAKPSDNQQFPWRIVSVNTQID